MTAAVLLLLAAGSPAPSKAGEATPADPSLSLPAPEQLKQARATYEYGNYASAIEQLEKLTDARRLESPQDQMEAYRLLGLAHFFSSHNDGARRAFVNLLSLDPDFQLDPLYVPPQAIAFFEQVRRENQELLEPIRLRRRATQEALAQEEAARRRLLAQVNGGPTQTIVERVDRPSPLIALLPFGAGQFQNGNKALGVLLALTEGLALATSVGSFFWVLDQTSPDGTYRSSVYQSALTVRDVQIATGVGFGAAWLLGAGEAFWHMRSPIITREDGAGLLPATPTPPRMSVGFAPLSGGGGLGNVSLAF